MISSILLLLGAALAYVIYNKVSLLFHNIARAKASGLPYYITPIHPFDRIGQLFSFAWVPLFKLLPRKYWEDLLPILQPDWHSRDEYRPFEKLGETFLIVSPSQLHLFTASAEAIHQITSKRDAFPKATESYALLEMYGKNVLTTEGTEWRMHRKITSASFNERNAALVFTESINQTEGLIAQWLGPDGKGNKTIETLEHDTMALMLHIIGYVGFGLRLLWAGQSLPADADPKLAKYSTLDPPPGHSLNFEDSVAHTIEHIIYLLLTPTWLLRILPFKSAKAARKAQDNYLKYMDEFLHDKIEDVKKGNSEEGMDIMGQLVRTSYGDTNGSSGSKKDAKLRALSDAEIIGNAFIMIVAGHETTANVMHFTLVELANNPAAQRLVQRDVDNIFGKTDPHTWDYEASVNPLLASYVGAAMNETLRTLPPVVDIPKEVSHNQDQPLILKGEKHMVPSSTHVNIVTIAAHRNPHNWPGKPSKITGADQDLSDYVPERWYRTASADSDSDAVEGADTEDFGGFAGPDTSSQLFRPVRGSYVPFSDGARSCLGRRIAQVEMIAALAVTFQKYSIELAVDEWASDAEVENMSREQRREVYKKAQDKAREIIKEVTTILTLKLHGNKFIPVRLVPRGQERFVDWLDS